jgi:putative peptidoglycan lipid II flippase
MAGEVVEPERIGADDGFSLRRIGKAAGLLAAAALAGQVVTVGRELFIAAQVGAGARLDAVLVAITPPLVVAGILSSGVRAALVPAYFEMETRRGTAAARRLIGGLLTWVTLLGLIATGVLLVFPGAAVGIAGPGLDPAAREDAASYARIAAPLLVLGTLFHLLTGVCQIHNRFAPIGVSMVLGPLISLMATIALWPALDLGALPVALLLGQVGAALALLLVAARAGMLPRPRIRFEQGAVADFIRHAGPLAAGSAILQFNLLSDRAIASLIGAGSISALRYGQQIVIEPLGALTLAWSTVIYPAIVRRALATANDLGESLARAARAALALATPAAMWMAAVAPLVVEVVYLRGAFDQFDVSITAAVVTAFAPMILLSVVQPVLTGAHNARRRATLLGMVAVANAVLNLILNVVFGTLLGVGGIALSSSVTVSVLLAFLATRISEPGFDLRAIAGYGLRAFVASAVAVAPSLLVARAITPGLGLALVPILAGLGLVTAMLYPVIARRAGIAEPMVVAAAVAGRGARLHG